VRTAGAGVGGRRLVLAKAADRLELRLPATAHAGAWSAYRVEAGRLAALPVGSAFDEQSGRFYWQPGPGFHGAYDLVFVRGDVQVPVTVLLDAGPPAWRASIQPIYRRLFSMDLE
jgi:hypothetical protein